MRGDFSSTDLGRSSKYCGGNPQLLKAKGFFTIVFSKELDDPNQKAIAFRVRIFSFWERVTF